MASDQEHRRAFLSLPELAVVVGIISVLIAVLIPAVHRAREAARRTQSRNNLKLIGIALHNYHDCYKVLPSGGVFNTEGVGFHEWTTMIAPFFDQNNSHTWIDYNRPWDDPRQVDVFHMWKQIYTNPSLPEPTRPDGLISNHYAGSQTVFYRNSSVSLKQIDDTASRMLVADAYGQFLPVGAPYGWRDVTLGLASDPAGFGCSAREITQCLMADGSVRVLSQDASDEVLQGMSGPADQRPTDAQTARIADYPLMDMTRIWKAELRRVDSAESERSKSQDVFVLVSPDGQTVERPAYNQRGFRCAE